MECAVWKGSREELENGVTERAVKETYLRGLGARDDAVKAGGQVDAAEGEGRAFWAYDEGLEEIQRIVKDA